LINFSILFSLSASQASDYVNKEKFDSFFDNEIRASRDQKSEEFMEVDTHALQTLKVDPVYEDQLNTVYRKLLEQKIRKRIDHDKTKVDIEDDKSLIMFIYNCMTNHCLLSDYPEAELDFYQSEDTFQDYLGDHWRNNAQLKKYWYWYYCKAAMLFLKIEDFTEVEKCLVKMGEIDPINLRSILGSFVTNGVKDWNAANEKNLNKKQEFDVEARGLVLQNYATLYENVRKSMGIEEFDSIDLITLSILRLFGGDCEKGIELGLKALEGIWPSREDPFFKLQSSPERLKSAMASTYYELKQFERAATFYLQVPEENRDLRSYLHLTCIFGSVGSWDVSFENFKIFQGLSMNRAGYLFSITEPEAIILMKMLMTRSLQDFNKYGKPFIQSLKKQVPHLEKDIDLLLKHIRDKKEAESNRIIRRAIAQQHLDTIHGLYQFFDQQYQNLWAHGSLLPSEAIEESFSSLNDIAKNIENVYSKLVSLKAKGSYADNIATIIELSESLKKNLALFSSTVKELNHQISKLRRQHYKAALQSTTTEHRDFVEFKPSLKAQTLAELKQKEVEAKAKEETVLSKQQRRKQNRTPLNEAYQEKSQQNVSQKEDGKSSSVMQSSLRSFKDKKLQSFWETNDSNEYSENVRKMLKKVRKMLIALDKAQSIFQLRNYLKSGAMLEILSGDREGQTSLRVNGQYRLCFYWITGEGAYNVELVDYHR
jgi:proteic killer suppression protein